MDLILIITMMSNNIAFVPGEMPTPVGGAAENPWLISSTQ